MRLIIIALSFFFLACNKEPETIVLEPDELDKPCPGYERVLFGSGCRETTGQRRFVDKEKCNPCPQAKE